MFFLLPYGNDRPAGRFPLVTSFLIGLNVAIFVVMLPVERSAVIHELGLIPARLSLMDFLTSMFTHADVYHLCFNMLFLWLFGPNVEDVLGRVEYAIFYVGSGFAAALLNLAVVHWFIPEAISVPTVGASGAIAGILGLFAVRFYKTKIRVFWFLGVLFYPIRWGTFRISAVVGLMAWFVQQLVGGLASIANPLGGGVAYWSHIGGMVFGMVLAQAAHMGLEGKREYLMADAQTSLERGTSWDAAERLRTILKSRPDDPEAHGELARCYAIQGDADRAIPHYRRSIELYLDKGDCARAVERYDQLKHFYRNARLGQKSELRLAVHLVETGNWAAALEPLAGICSAYPGTPEAETSMIRIADVHMKHLNDPTSAIRWYERFLREYPQSEWRAVAERLLAEARHKRGHPPRTG